MCIWTVVAYFREGVFIFRKQFNTKRKPLTPSSCAIRVAALSAAREETRPSSGSIDNEAQHAVL